VLSRVTLLVPDYEAGRTFFVDGLGWAVVEDVDEGRKRWLVVAPPGGNGAALVLARPTSPGQEAALGAQAGDRVAFFLSTDDFDRDAARIAAAGGTFLEDPRDEPYGRVAQWRDPWGNRWDLIQPA
jgi:predicted enzyme related to lactoylglutathione lyase